MSTEAGVGAVILKFMVGIAEKTGGSAISSAVRWCRSSNVLIVGQDRAGKTSFRDYLQYGHLDVEKETAKTTDPHSTGSFTVPLGSFTVS